jgi:uncharacterized protein YbjT (DUF2867 family)
MTQKQTIATVFGGTGFVGRQIIRELARRGMTVKIATRVPERAYFLRTCGTVGQIVPFACDYSSADSIARAVSGSDYVINCIGILFEKGKRNTFAAAHIETAGAIAAACTAHRVKRFVQISSLGVDKAGSEYAKSKRAGEELVLARCPKAIILRPSVIFGEDDSFFNMFARMARVLPALPLIGGGHTKFQPVFVGDVADAVMAALDHEETQGRIFELGGPEIVTFREIYERLFRYTGAPRPLVVLPFGLAKIQAFFMSILPHPPLTPDQVESLKTDNIVSPDALSLADLGLTPTPMDLILPTYLSAYRRGGKFADKKAA